VDDALTSECQLEAHLWVTFVQSRAEAQPVFRTCQDYDACFDDLEPSTSRCLRPGSSDARSRPCNGRSYNGLELRFTATVGQEEPEVEVGLV
jgi:hypothetical protein